MSNSQENEENQPVSERFTTMLHNEEAEWIKSEAAKLGIKPGMAIRLKLRAMRLQEQNAAIKL